MSAFPTNLRTTVALFLGCSSAALADNAALTSGGQPKMMPSHPQITMQSEVVKLVVHWNRVDTDCSFVFVNHGGPCAVNMGFPDFGLWAYASPLDEPKSMFKSYRSFLDGKTVATKLVLGQGPGEQWQTKTVRFSKNQTRVAREIYTTEMGGISLDKKNIVGVASYILHTGASWKGNIGSARITVTFAPDFGVTGPFTLSKYTEKNLEPKIFAGESSRAGRLIVLSGPNNPTLDGATLTFAHRDWRPAISDDILVAFGYPKKLLDALHNESVKLDNAPLGLQKKLPK